METEFDTYEPENQKRWTAAELRRRIAEGERLLDEVARAKPDPKLDWIRSLLEEDLRHKRATLLRLRQERSPGPLSALLHGAPAVGEPPPE